MPAMVWSTIEAAIHAWVVAGTGLSASAVLWAQQAAPEGAAAYATIRPMALQRIGQDWIDVTDAAVPAAGAEIKHNARGVRVLTLVVTVYKGGHRGTTSPLARAEGFVAAARLPLRREALNAAGVGVGSFGPVQSIDGVVGLTTFEPRAMVEARLNLASEVSELGTYIESCEIEGLDSSDDELVILPEFEVS